MHGEYIETRFVIQVSHVTEIARDAINLLEIQNNGGRSGRDSELSFVFRLSDCE